MEHLMVYPVAAMILLTAIVLARSYRMNVAAVRAREVRLSQLRVFETSDLPPNLMWNARNVSNLFETPVVFYLLAVFLCLFQKVNEFYLVCAWTYVVSRYLHSYIHVTTNDVIKRFRVFMFGCLLCWLMWTVFVVQMVMDN